MKTLRKQLATNKRVMKAVAQLMGWCTTSYISPHDKISYPYAVYVPAPAGAWRACPLIVALHGQRGTIYEFVWTDMAKLAKKYGFIIACPESGKPFHENSGEQDVFCVIKDIQAQHNIDEKRIYLLGISLGGRGTTYIGFRNPDVFAAVALIYGAVTEEELTFLTAHRAKPPAFIAHGTLDAVIPVTDSRRLVRKLAALGCEYRFKLVEGLGHDLRVLDTVLPEMLRFFEEHPKQYA